MEFICLSICAKACEEDRTVKQRFWDTKENVRQKNHQDLSHCGQASGSLLSRRSPGSSTSAAAALARAEAQAAKAEAAFAGQESQIKMEQASLEAFLKV